MMAKAMVTMAKYKPETRMAGIPTKRPADALMSDVSSKDKGSGKPLDKNQA
jgi:hypothetical protein